MYGSCIILISLLLIISYKTSEILGLINILKYNRGIFICNTCSTQPSQYLIDGHENLKPALNGDIVQLNDQNNKVLRIHQRAKHTDIPGILELRSKIIYGTNKRGVPIYVFKPSDKSYPNFLVASHLKKDSGNQYVLINFHDWLSTSKLPNGTLATVLGPVGDLKVEYENIIHKYGSA